MITQVEVLDSLKEMKFCTLHLFSPFASGGKHEYSVGKGAGSKSYNSNLGE